ncbi:c-type cytochrome biogenesis protein CcsB [Candidatus Saganbacteria bacterium]|nr:c-type cytochrome biogenesis protein CcsB [Candidatus Saganbacteria bacterium]
MLSVESNFLSYAILSYLISMVSYFIYVSFKKENVGSFATLILSLGFILHTVSIIARTISSGRLPFSNLYESMTSFAWGIILIYLVIEFMYKLKIIGIIAVPIGFLAALYASTLNKSIETLMPALQSNWLLAHVSVAIVSYGVLAISFSTACLYLLKEYFNFKWLPKKEMLDDLTYKLIAFAFPFLTLVIITGAVWAEQSWGTYWSWDPKETWSLITWLVYLGYLHARLILGWKGKVAIWFALIGFVVVIFTYLGVNLLLSGLHSYAS